MGITDKVTGRVKQAAGDLAGDESVRREGLEDERKGEAKQELRREQAEAERQQARVEQKAEEVRDLETGTTRAGVDDERAREGGPEGGPEGTRERDAAGRRESTGY